MRKATVIGFFIFILANNICFADVTFKQGVEKSAAGMKIYKMALDKLDYNTRMERLYTVLENAGLKGAQEKQSVRTNRFVGFSSDKMEAIISETGSEMMFTDLKGLKLTEKTGDLPDEKEAVEIAQKFLAQGELVDLKRKELVVGHIGGLKQGLATPRSNSATEKKAVAVHFNRELDGFSVMNQGSHITVMIGDRFSPVNMYYSWREISKVIKVVPESDLVPPEEVKKRIVEDVSRVFDMDQQIIIDRIYLVYYDRGQNYIQPAYCYEGRAEGKTDEPQPVLGYVASLADPPEPVHHPAYLSDVTFPIKPR